MKFLDEMVKCVVSHLEGESMLCEFINDSLEHKYVVSDCLEYKGSMILLSSNGPIIYVNTEDSTVVGQWGNESFAMKYIDKIGLDDFMNDQYQIMRT